jgi:N-acetylmuramic acid 6-phosphate etherase
MPEPPVTERDNPDSSRLDEMSSLEFARLMNAEDARVAPAIAQELEPIARAIDAIAERMKEGGRLLYVGAGTSGRLGVLDASECPPTFGTRPELVVGLIAGGESALTRAIEGAEDRRELALIDLARVGLSARDVLVGVSASGRTPYVLAAIEQAKWIGAFTVGLSCDRDGPLARLAALAITPVVGPEVVTGSTRLKAGTATKLVLNMLSTGAMVKLGRVRGNLMVNLNPGSAKLRGRAVGIVARLAGIDEARARELLDRCDGSVRAAIDAAKQDAAPRTESLERPVVTALVAGVDGGGTKTEAWLAASEAAVLDLPLGTARGGGCNLTTNFEQAADAIEQAVVEAFVHAARDRAPVDALCVAAAGSADPVLRDRLRERLIERGIARQVAVVHDAAPIVAGACREGFGVALISGTGSFCFARDGAGRCARAGGLGPYLGDEGSAYALGRAAVTAAARAADGRGATLELVKRIFDELGTRDARKLAQWASLAATEPQRIAALAPQVMAAADKGDPVAARILERAASELALLVKTVVLKLKLPRQKLPIVLCGGVLDHSERLRHDVLAMLRSLGVEAEAREPMGAAAGAVALARELLAGRLDEASWFPA